MSSTDLKSPVMTRGLFSKSALSKRSLKDGGGSTSVVATAGGESISVVATAGGDSTGSP
jgi:hypothetical protein